MRIEGTIYPPINKLPASAVVVSKYATDNNTAVGYVYIKYKRFKAGKGEDPGYTIRCFQGSNFVIPN